MWLAEQSQLEGLFEMLKADSFVLLKEVGESKMVIFLLLFSKPHLT